MTHVFKSYVEANTSHKSTRLPKVCYMAIIWMWEMQFSTLFFKFFHVKMKSRVFVEWKTIIIIIMSIFFSVIEQQQRWGMKFKLRREILFHLPLHGIYFTTDLRTSRQDNLPSQLPSSMKRWNVSYNPHHILTTSNF